MPGGSRLSAPDIFLSYNREDAVRAKQFAEGFAAEGFDVWWDVALRSGEAYDEVTENALHEAKAASALWSPRSVVSRWVRSEATIADRNKTLVPAMIEPCRRPVMFELTQTAELSDWDGNARAPAWRAFLEDVRGFVGGERKVAAAPAPVGPATDDKLSIIVLPFENMSGDPEQEYFADGISEDVITDLGKVSSLMVVARNTAFTFKGKHVDVGDVARQLHVTHVLEGSVRKAGNRVRVSAQLIDGKTGGQLWSERWDRDLDDIFELQDELSEAIVGALKLKMLPQEKKAIEDRGTTSIEAYDLFLRARSLAATTLDLQDFEKSQQLLQQALAIDPEFSAALNQQALLYHLSMVLHPDQREAIKSRLDDLCSETIARSPDNWGAKVLLGCQLGWERNWFESLEALEQATALAPAFESDVATMFAFALADVGRASDAIKVLEAIRVADPLSRMASNYLQLCYPMVGRLDDADAEFRRSQQLVLLTEAIEHTAFFRMWARGNIEAAKAQFSRYLKAQSVPMPFMADYLEVIDQPAAALAILHRAVDDPANDDGTRLILIAGHLAIHGDPELALAATRRAVVDHASRSQLLLWDGYRKNVRQLPGFKDLVRDLGIADYWRQSGNWGDFARPKGADDFEIIA